MTRPEGWPRARYGAILCDPPWRLRTWNERNQAKSASRYYPLMTTDSICQMGTFVQEIADEHCALFLWAVYPMLPQALQVMEAWGFRFRTVAFTWVKQTPSGQGFHYGLGYYTRANPEICLLGIRGKVKRLDRGVANLMIAPRRDHSRKPDDVYPAIERIVPGPFVELFARQRREGWDAWGNDPSLGIVRKAA